MRTCISGVQVAEAGGVQGLAQRLAAGCTKPGLQQQLQLARACYSWVVHHCKPPHAAEAGSVTAPLFEEPLAPPGPAESAAPADAMPGRSSTAGEEAYGASSQTAGSGSAGHAATAGSRRSSRASRASSAASSRRLESPLAAALSEVPGSAEEQGHEGAAGQQQQQQQHLQEQGPDVLVVPKGRAEAALLGPTTGTWAERVSSLMVQLARGCGLLAVQISGWARGGLLGAGLLPGQTLAAHNHSWAAVKVNGRWRLLDPAYAVMRAGDAPFFAPPEAFAHCHLPFESFWQLLEAPLSPQQWWALPEASPQLFAAGMRLLSSGLGAVNATPAPRPGGRQPAVCLRVAAPAVANQQLQLAVLDERLQEVSSWQQGAAEEGAGRAAGAQQRLVFQQAMQYCEDKQQELLVALPGMAAAAPCPAPAVGSAAPVEVCFGARRFSSPVSELWASLPGPGSWYLELRLVRTLPGAVKLRLQGLEQPLSLDVHTTEALLRVGAAGPAASLPSSMCWASALEPVSIVIHERLCCCLQARFDVPPPAQHDPGEDAPQLGDDPAAAVPPASLPHAAPAFSLLRCQLLAPAAPQRLEADRPCGFRLAVPGGRAVVVGCEEAGWWPLNRERAASGSRQQQQQQQQQQEQEQEQQEGAPVFSGEVVLPRCATCHVLAALDADAAAQLPEPRRAAAAAGWVPLLVLPVAVQVQHVVALPQPAVTSSFLESDPLVGDGSGSCCCAAPATRSCSVACAILVRCSRKARCPCAQGRLPCACCRELRMSA
jgi:hypothetical protein